LHPKAKATESRPFQAEKGMSSAAPAPLRIPIHLLIRELDNHIQVVLAASELGYYESALEAQLLAKQVLDAIREELLRPHGPVQHPCRDLDT
jgi:hypothetical protein